MCIRLRDALIGASARTVPSNVRFGIHANRPRTQVAAGAREQEQVYNNLRVYMLEMGVDPGVVDLAKETPWNRLHRLSRKEIIRFGIESRAPFETGWMMYQEPAPPRRILMLKSVTQAKGSDGREFRTTNIQVTCASYVGTWVELRRELATNEIGLERAVSMTVGDKVIKFYGIADSGVTVRQGAVAERDFVLAALSQKAIPLTETFFSQNAPRWSRDVIISTKGLEQALQTPLKNCGDRAVW